MPTHLQSSDIILTTHARQRMDERGVHTDDLVEAAADGQVVTQAGGRREVRGRNGVSFITDPTGEVVLTVLPRGSRPVRTSRANCGLSRHRPRTRRPAPRTDTRRPGQASHTISRPAPATGNG